MVSASPPGRPASRPEDAVVAYRARDGRALWRRGRPAGRLLLEPLRHGVAARTTAEPLAEHDATRVSAFDARGEDTGCEKLEGPPDEGGTPRADASTDSARELIATVAPAGGRSRVRLLRDGGRDEAWSTGLDGEWGRWPSPGTSSTAARWRSTPRRAAWCGSGPRCSRRTRWRHCSTPAISLGPGKVLSSFPRAGPRIYALGGTPMVVSAADGRGRRLASRGDPNAYWFGLGGGSVLSGPSRVS